MYVPWLAFSSCLRRLRLRAAVDSPKTKVLPTSNIRSFFVATIDTMSEKKTLFQLFV